ncbi:lactoylglutathione lyase [Ekhidna lutea]|uniref:Lactoylglutathione lyase n=1 Tax=Ekhidna lutea TaxID=447679 RepID=A0A239KM50_EKHLU|nr:VOC family protein [Ekhidna lutea]SNT19231.1 lactoylglutathione lyase [Ekhidna lutea]
MKILGLRTTIYHVPNLDEAKAWYSEAFETKPYFDEPFYVGFNVAGYELGLVPDERPAQEKSDNVESFWGVENVEEAHNNLIKQGATEHVAPTNVGGEIVVSNLKDPWGNVIGLIYNPDFKAE